ncbi:unnamed protein product [Sphagnum balticum]
MSIKDDFQPYVDGNKLLAPNPQNGNLGKGSDNGPMYTAEYFIMLKRNNALQDADVVDYASRIGACVNPQGMLCRVPVGQDDGQEEVDDYYGVTNGCMEMGNTAIPRKMLWALIRYAGCMNNESPGTFTWDAFLARQLQLVCAVVSSAFPSKWNPLHYLVRLLAFPVYLYSAVILLTSCIDTASSDTDSRRLAWHLGNNVSKVSLMNWLAFKVWKNRLNKTYPNGMKDVAAIYYQPNGNNPYSEWWKT